MSSPLLQSIDLCKSYARGEQKIEVLKNINLTVQPREMVAVVGASGSGKTTLLQVLGTLDSPDSGQMLFRGRDMTRMPEKELAAHRNRHIGFIFQFHHLLPEFTALENVMMPGMIQGLNRSDLERDARDLLRKVKLDHRSDHRSGELSGGEQQRVALARALVMKPALLLADEPTGNLDSVSGTMVFSLLKDLSDSLDLCVIMVTHNQQLARAMDRCLTLTDGALI